LGFEVFSILFLLASKLIGLHFEKGKDIYLQKFKSNRPAAKIEMAI
jgi:hypothetical protein